MKRAIMLINYGAMWTMALAAAFLWPDRCGLLFRDMTAAWARCWRRHKTRV